MAIVPNIVVANRTDNDLQTDLLFGLFDAKYMTIVITA